MAKEAYYFSHDANSRNDPKILSMMLDYGIEGYGMFWIVVENLREQDGYKLKQDKSTWRALAMQMHKTVDDSKAFIEECINEYELFETDGISFYSLSLLRRMNKKDIITQKRKDAANARWDNNKDTKVMQVHSKSNTDAMQLDAKESKLNEIKEIITYLNVILDSSYQHTAKKTQEVIKARIKDGYTVEDFKIVIDKKYKEWLGTEQSKYLRPETLFGTKFEGYLNQIETKAKEKQKYSGEKIIRRDDY